jgi:nicotinamide-nucleotide amidase
MHAMYHAEVAPRLKALTEMPSDHGVTNIKFSGVGESSFQDKLDAALHEIPDLEIGYCARPGELDLRLIGSDSNRKTAADLAIKTYPQQYINDDGRSLEETVVHELTEKYLKLSLAESCTGGIISSRITDVPGSSAVFTHGYVTYANEAKVTMIGVNEENLETYGAVSDPVAKDMAEGALNHSGADITVSVTGTAGPTGGTEEKPVGTVWLGLSVRHPDHIHTSSEMKFYPNGRAVFKQLVSQAVLMKILRTVREL